MIRNDDPLLVSLFAEAVRLPGSERDRFIESRSPDGETAAALHRLLAAHGRASVIDRPALGPRFRVPEPGELPERSHPQCIGPYRILRRVGAGVTSVVYLAEQQAPVRRKVALKVLRSLHLDSDLHRRFLAEQQALAQIDHPRIAPILHAAVTDEGAPFFTMRYVDGDHLTTFCRGNGLARASCISLLAQACEAVHAAHLAGVHHRDLKPSNVLVEQPDGVPAVAIIDFGIAKVEQGEPLLNPPDETQVGTLIGSLGYMAPEQLDRKWRPADARVDIYSLGCLLYEVVTGQPAFPAEQADSLAELVEQRKARPLTLPRRRFDPRLRAIVERATAPDPADRYQSVAALAADLRSYAAGRPVAARSFSFWERAWLRIRRRPLRYFGIASVALGLLAALGWLQAERQAERVNQAAMRSTATVLTQTVLPALERTIGTRAEREQIYDTLLAPLEQYAERFPDDHEIQLSLAALLAADGGDRLGAGDIELARQQITRARDIVARLHERDPGDLALARRTAELTVRVGDCHKAEADWRTALDVYEEAHAAVLALREAHPDHSGLTDDLIYSHNRLAEAAFHCGLPAKEASHRESQLTLARQLFAVSPDDPAARAALLTALLECSGFERQAGRFDGLVALAREAIEHATVLVELVPNRRAYQRKLALAQMQLGFALIRDAELKQADGALQAARRGFEQILRDEPGHLQTVLGLVRTLATLAALYQETDDFAAAVDLASEGLRHLKTVAVPSDQAYLLQTELHWAVCRGTWSLGRTDQAGQVFDIVRDRADWILANAHASPASLVVATRTYALAAECGIASPPEAIEACRVAVERAPHPDAELLRNLGIALAAAGRHDEAAEVYVEALAACPDDASGLRTSTRRRLDALSQP